MKFLIKIEEAINALLEVLFSKTWFLLCGLVPDFIKRKKEQVVFKSKFLIEGLIRSAIDLKIKSQKRVVELKETVMTYIVKIKLINFKEIIDEKKSYIKENILDAPGTWIKSLFLKIKEQWQIYSNKFTNQGLGFYVKISITSLILFAIGSNIIYQKSKKVFSPSQVKREIASLEDDLSYERKDYYKSEERLYKIFGVSLPIEVEELTDLKSIKLDISIIASNRYIVLFLKNNEEALMNHIISNLLPTVSTYPLNEEGEDIIKTLLTTEINNFLKAYNIEGKVEVKFWGYDAY